MTALRYRTACFLLLVACLAAGPAAHAGLPADDHQLRVRILELNAPEAVALSGHGGALHLYAGDYREALAVLQPGQQAVVTRSNDQLHVRLGETALYARALRIEPAAGAETAVTVEAGRAKVEGRRYQGQLFIDPDPERPTLRLVNQIGLEDYVAGVVAREYGLKDEQGTRAMAVVVRTYALSAVEKFGPTYAHVDHTASQMYQGTERVTPAIREAVRATQGEIVTYQSKPIQAVYFSSSGGHTADNESVWQAAPLPYLRGKPDPYDTASPYAQWQSSLSRPELLRALTRQYGFEVTGFLLGDEDAGGRVTTIELLRQDGSRRAVPANDFRLLITRTFGAEAMRSTLFTAARDGDTYRLEGRGFGHGVGLCQWGAHEMARRGHSYREILQFYYTGVEIRAMDGLADSTPPAAPAEPPTPEEPPTTRRRIGW